MIYRFADLQLDLGRRELSRDGEGVHLTNLNFQVLKALVEAAPDLLSHDELIDQAWGENRVVTPENLSQRIKVLREGIGDDAEQPVYVEAVRGQGFRLIPEVILVAPQGLPPVSGQRIRWVMAGLIVVLALALVRFWPVDEAGYQRQVGSGDSLPGNSVAVLPFSNLSPDPDNAFYAAGLHEEVLNQLSQLKDLAVISRTSMLRYADTEQAIPDIARELNVESIVEGSVRYADDRIRVTIQLVNGKSDEHIWSQTYDRELKDFFDIESDIARNVAQALDHALTQEEQERLNRPATESLDAFAQYVLGARVMDERTDSAVREALEHFEAALELDPDYSMAWVGKANALAHMVEYGSMSPQESFAPRQVAIDRALELDPLAGEAWLAMSKLQLAMGNITDPVPHFLKSIELSPNYAQAYHTTGHHLANTNRAAEALPFLEKSLLLDPGSLRSRVTLGKTLFYLGRDEESLEMLYEGIRRNPEYPGFYRDLNEVLRRMGRLGEAMYWVNMAKQLPATTRYVRIWECDTLAALLRPTEAGRCYSELVEEFPMQKFSAIYIGLLKPDAAEIQQAFDAIEGSAQPIHVIGLMFAYFNQRDWVSSRAVLEGLIPSLFNDEVVELNANTLWAGVNAGMLLWFHGDTERANYLFDQVLEVTRGLDRIHSVSPMRIGDVVVHAVRGDEEAAIEALRDVYADGWRMYIWYLRQPQFDAMAENPVWQSLVSEIEAETEEQWEWYLQNRHVPTTIASKGFP